LAELRRWKLQAMPNPSDLVFVDALGQPTSRKQNNAMLRECAERAEIRALSMNNLRHSFASQQLINGTTALEVSHLMGHSSPAVTLDIYNHWTETEKSQAPSKTRRSHPEYSRRRGEGRGGRGRRPNRLINVQHEPR
jgi:site-specific recombinase XerD